MFLDLVRGWLVSGGLGDRASSEKQVFTAEARRTAKGFRRRFAQMIADQEKSHY
jgi:hypothetical protein